MDDDGWLEMVLECDDGWTLNQKKNSNLKKFT